MTTDPRRTDPSSSWRDDAACLEHPAEWFTGPHAPGDTRRAIEVCATCAVKQPCLETALTIEVSADLGIWGGTTPATRRHLRRQAEAPVTAAPIQALPGNSDTMHTVQARRAGLELLEDEHGDFVDRSLRVIVFEIHGSPPWMLMIDGQPRARTSSVEDAAALARRFLEAPATDLTNDRRSAPVKYRPGPWDDLDRQR